LRVDNDHARHWYMNESAHQNWSSRALVRSWIGNGPCSRTGCSIRGADRNGRIVHQHHEDYRWQLRAKVRHR
jgi:predicted nuclease of restriction endonuclease-like (RecB) superfamily